MTTVLVTGATGTVGSAVVRELRRCDVAVKAFVRDPDKAAAVLGDEVALVGGDLSDRESIRSAVEGVDRLFLACGNVPGQVEYETRAIDAAAEAGVERIVKLSANGRSPARRWPSGTGMAASSNTSRSQACPLPCSVPTTT